MVVMALWRLRICHPTYRMSFYDPFNMSFYEFPTPLIVDLEHVYFSLFALQRKIIFSMGSSKMAELSHIDGLVWCKNHLYIWAILDLASVFGCSAEHLKDCLVRCSSVFCLQFYWPIEQSWNYSFGLSL